MKQKINKIIITLLLMIIAISNIFVSDSNKYYKYVRIAGYLLLVVYAVIRIIQKNPIKIIQNKLDIAILMLVFSTAIPFVCNRYVTLNGTIQIILQYIYVYSIYLIFRECSKEVKNINQIIFNILIILTVIIIIIGIDGITSNKLKNIFEEIQDGNFINGENRLISLFGYSNVLAVYIASVMFLNINQYLKYERNDIKALYKTIIIIFIIGIILTYSKAVLVLFPILLLFYIIVIEDKELRLEIIQNMLLSFIMSLLFILIFEKLCNTQNYLLMWIIFSIIIFINYLINLIIEKINFKIKNLFSIRNVVFLIVFIGYVIIGLNIYDEYEVFNKEVEEDYKAKIVNNIEGNKSYLFEFDIESKAPKNIENTYTINLIERNEKNQELNRTEIKFGTFNGKKQIDVITKEDTIEIKIEFKSDYPYSTKKLIIKSLFINDKEKALKYKYLPTKLVEKVQNISFNYKTLKERYEMIQNTVELSKRNLLNGIGGNGWKFKYQEVQSYPYTSKFVHSYVAKVVLEFGILGLISYLIIIIIIIKIFINMLKHKNLEILSVLFAFFMIVTHSAIDVDMEYTHILTYVFILMGILSNQLNVQKNKGVIKSNICLILVTIISIYLTIDCSSYNIYSKIDSILNNQNKLEKFSQEYKELNNKLVKEYENLIKYERYNYLKNYYNIIICTINSNIENQLNIVEEYYEKIKIYDNKNYNNVSSILEKSEYLYSLIINLDKLDNPKFYEITQKFINLMQKEYEKIKNDFNINKLDSMYDEVNIIKNKYLLGTKILNETEIELNEEKLNNINVEESRKILLYHTHGTESYKSNDEYKEYEFYKSLDNNYNVIKIGDYLEEILSQKGMSVIHDRNYYNYPVKVETYNNSRKGVQKILDENIEINKIIDIHRDAISDIEHEASTIMINGEEVARLRFVIGINEENEEWLYDLKWAIEMQKLADKKYPGLFMPILIRKRNYNQDLARYAILIEVGENCNYIEHALNSIKYFSYIVK